MAEERSIMLERRLAEVLDKENSNIRSWFFSVNVAHVHCK
jgi:hypothetical protein